MKHGEQFIFWGLVVGLALYGWIKIRPLTNHTGVLD